MRVSELILELQAETFQANDPVVKVLDKYGKWRDVLSVHYAGELGKNCVTFMPADDDLGTPADDYVPGEPVGHGREGNIDRHDEPEDKEANDDNTKT